MLQLLLQMWLRLCSVLLGNALMVGTIWSMITAGALVLLTALLIDIYKED